MSKEGDKYHANGKFILTAEYLVMAGADALVMPINKGQELWLEESNNSMLKWESYYNNEIWFEAVFNPEQFQVLSSTDNSRADYIAGLLKNAGKLSKNMPRLTHAVIKTYLHFNPTWGMGSSSTLIVNLSRLFDINAFDLHNSVSKGSGFDIAAGLSGYPFRYRLKKNKREISPVILPDLFYKHAYFVYLGHKANTENAVRSLKYMDSSMKLPIKYINEITAQFQEVESFRELSRITAEHESFMSEVLDLTSPVIRFSDYPYGIKSLGAWGGDFVMAMHPRNKEEVEKYFHHKGCPVVFSAKELKIN